jgi:hypothetical protein
MFLKYPSAVTDRWVVGLERAGRSNARSTLVLFSWCP